MGVSTVFSQIVKLIPRTEFESWTNKYNGDHGTRRLDCWTWFGALLFGQISGHDSIRSLERIFAHNDLKMKQLGFGSVRKSTLSDANKTRPLEILEEAFEYTLKLAQRHAPKKNGFKFSGNILALDSTTIELCLTLSPWAVFRRASGAAKLHTAIDIAGDLPRFSVITSGKIPDISAARKYFKKQFKANDTIIFDRGYNDYGWFSDLTENNIFFVTRQKQNCDFKVYESRPTDRTRGIICDQLVYLRGLAGKRYKGKIRRISYRDPDTKRKFTFLTNRMDLAAKTICDLYKARWKVELFFRTMKGHLKIKRFLGTSYHAVRAQILVALIGYLLIQTLRFIYQLRISMPDAMAVVGVFILIREPLANLLGNLPRITRHPRSSQLVLNI